MCQNSVRMSPFRRAANRLLHLLARYLPGATSLRPALHRLRGVQVGEGVFIGDEVYLENEYPDAIEIQSGVQISLRAIVMAHTRGPGQVVIEKDAFIGPSAIIVASGTRKLRIGEGAVIGAAVVITRDVPAHLFVASPEAKPVATARVPLSRAEKMDDFICGLAHEPQTFPPSGRGPVRARQLGPGMTDRQGIRIAVFRAIERVRKLSLDESSLAAEESTVLLGEGAALDSMGFVNFVVALEEEMTGVTEEPVDVVQLLNCPESHSRSNCTAGELIDLLSCSAR